MKYVLSKSYDENQGEEKEIKEKEDKRKIEKVERVRPWPEPPKDEKPATEREKK